jgi:putative transposase
MTSPPKTRPLARKSDCVELGLSGRAHDQETTQYAGLKVSDVKKLRQLEDHSRRLKQIVAEHALDIQALNAVTAKYL